MALEGLHHAEHALQDFHGVRAYSDRVERSTPLLERIGFVAGGARPSARR